MSQPLIELLVKLAFDPQLAEQLSPEWLDQQGISDPQAQQALLQRDHAGLLAALGGAAMMLNNNGTVYTLGGTVQGQLDNDRNLLTLDRSLSYDLILGIKDTRLRYYGRIEEGTIAIKSVDQTEE